MSWNVTPWWMLCNPFKLPLQEGFYIINPKTDKRAGPYTTYNIAKQILLNLGGKIIGEEKWLY